MCNLHRRQFLASGALTLGGMVGIPRLAFGDPDAVNDELVVVVFLRGGIDGLSLALPLTGADRGYYEAARPRLKIPVTGTGAALPLNGFLGLHPAANSHAGGTAASLYDYYHAGRLAIVHACGLDHPTRSHFDAQAFMELGTPGVGGTGAGWLTRHFQTAGNLPPDIIMPSLAVGSSQQASLLGNLETINMEDPGSFSLNNIGHWEWRQAQRVALRQMINSDNDPVHQTSLQALDAVGIIETYVSGNYTPSNGAIYPNNGFGEQMSLIARLAKLNLGLRAATIDYGGWDTHDGQGSGPTGLFANNVATLTQGMAALYQDLDGAQRRRAADDAGRHERVRPPPARERRLGDGPWTRQRHAGDGRPRQRRRARGMARTGQRPALRRGRSGHHHRLPARAQRDPDPPPGQQPPGPDLPRLLDVPAHQRRAGHGPAAVAARNRLPGRLRDRRPLALDAIGALASMTKLGSAALAMAAALLAAPAGAQTNPCGPLPPPAGAIIDVTPSQAGQLASIVAGAPAGSTIRLANGTYALGGALLNLRAPGVTLRSLSGNAASVVLDNNYQGGDLVAVTASNVTVADLTVQRAYFHPIHVAPSSGPLTGALVHNVRVIDPGEQGIKINPNAGFYADAGEIRCSRVELTDLGRPFIRNNCYTGGIDGHQAVGWRVHDNVIAGFWCSTGLSEHGIHFWTGSRDTVVERNVLRNNARGVGFGLGFNTPGRTYPDAPCPGVTTAGHFRGVIRNNFVVVNDPRVFSQGSGGFDAGIALEQVCLAETSHNTVYSTQPPFSSIEWRWAGNAGRIANNLVSHNLRARDGATATVAGNIPNGPATLVVDLPGSGDLHLRVDAAAAIDHGVVLPPGTVDGDIDLDPRDAAPDVGADEQRVTFADVPRSHFAWRYVESVYARGVTGGCATNPLRFCPDAAVSRAQMAVFLLRAKLGPAYVPPAATGDLPGRAGVRPVRALDRGPRHARRGRGLQREPAAFLPDAAGHARPERSLPAGDGGRPGLRPAGGHGRLPGRARVRSVRALGGGAGAPPGHRRLQRDTSAVLSRPGRHPRPGRGLPGHDVRSPRSVTADDQRT